MLTCIVLEGKDVAFSWFKDGRLIRPGDRISVLATKETSMLSISHVSSQDSGAFSCLGSNGIAEERMEKVVFVEGKIT